MREWYPLAILLILIPFASAWILPHQTYYDVDPGQTIHLCSTVFLDHNALVRLICGDKTVGEANVLARTPAVLCYAYAPTSSTHCVWTDGIDEERVTIHTFPNALVDAILAILLVVLVVRFTVKLVRITM
jgi:hypothetical protein